MSPKRQIAYHASIELDTGAKDMICSVMKVMGLINKSVRYIENVFTARLDVAASYPNGQLVENISKETTSKEIIKIQYVSEEDQRRASINLSAGKTNAVEICTTVFKLPELSTLLDIFNGKELNNTLGSEI